jgi:hypothetical protein
MIYKFTEPKDTACFVCDHVLTKHSAILYATHEAEDGFWQFLCGEHDHADDDYKIISLGQAVGIDESINDLYEMPLGIGADRETQSAKWIPFKLNS